MMLYRLLLLVLPRRFRARHGAEMRGVFAEQLEEAKRRGAHRLVWLYLRATLDVVGVRARMRGVSGIDGGGGMMEGWVGNFASDVRGAIRGFRRTPGFTVAAVCTLGVGIGAVTAVYSVVHGVVLSPLPYPDPDQLVVIYNEYPTLDVERGSQSPGDLDDYRAGADLLSEVGSVSTFPQTILEEGQPRRVEVAVVTSGFLEMLSVEPTLGRDIAPDDDHDVAIVSHEYWRDELGGRPDVLGTPLSFAGMVKTVIGVLPEDFRLVVPGEFGVPTRPAVWTPIPAQGWGRDTGDRTAHWMNVVGRLADYATLEEVRGQMDGIAAGQRELLPHRAEREAQIGVVPLQEEIVRDVRSALLALLAAASVVVLIACANVANLLLVRAQRRAREIAVRSALGAGRVRIVRQLVTEGFVLGLAGASVGVAVARVSLPAVLKLEPGSLPRAEDVSMDLSVFAFGVALAATATLVFSVAPVWLALRRPPSEAMRHGRSTPARKGSLVASGLIVAELSLSLLLLIGGGVLVRSFAALSETDPGFETENILTFRAPLPGSAFQQQPPEGYTGRPEPNFVRKPYYDELTQALGEIPGVRSVGAIFPAPFSGEVSGSVYATEATVGDEEGELASSQLVTPEYFETVGIPFVEGRTFLPGEIGDKLVIDRRMAESLWPGESALGKRLEIGWWSGPVWGEVVGVVENVRTHSLREDNPPTVYRLGTVYAYSALTMALEVRGDPFAIVENVRAVVTSIEPEAPLLDVRSMDEYVADQSSRTRFVLALVGVFAGLASALATVGLYGVISYAVGARVREYGIRLAFGAGRARVFRLVLRRGGAITAVGVGLGLVAAYLAQRFIEPFLFSVRVMDPLTVAATVVGVAIVSFLACSVPASRAMLVDPVRSLRAE